jgi:heme o synthase
VWINLRIVAELIKLRVALAVVLSAAVGYLMLTGGVTSGLFLVSAGVLLMACGSAALNHVQEHRSDLLMERTQQRPIPAGKVSVTTALIASVALSLTGFVILWAGFGIVPALLGAATLLLYNGVYTPLKKVTPYALLPGSVVGAIPPLIGYSAAQGCITNPDILMVALFFLIWQVPHFMLLLLRHGDDYLKAGFNTLNRSLSTRQLSLITVFWLVMLSVSACLFPLFGIINNSLYIILTLTAAVVLVVAAIPLLNPASHHRHIPIMFRIINLFMLLMAHLIMFQHLKNLPLLP